MLRKRWRRRFWSSILVCVSNTLVDFMLINDFQSERCLVSFVLESVSRCSSSFLGWFCWPCCCSLQPQRINLDHTNLQAKTVQLESFGRIRLTVNPLIYDSLLVIRHAYSCFSSLCVCVCALHTVKAWGGSGHWGDRVFGRYSADFVSVVKNWHFFIVGSFFSPPYFDQLLSWLVEVTNRCGTSGNSNLSDFFISLISSTLNFFMCVNNVALLSFHCYDCRATVAPLSLFYWSPTGLCCHCRPSCQQPVCSSSLTSIICFCWRVREFFDWFADIRLYEFSFLFRLPPNFTPPPNFFPFAPISSNFFQSSARQQRRLPTIFYFICFWFVPINLILGFWQWIRSWTSFFQKHVFLFHERSFVRVCLLFQGVHFGLLRFIETWKTLSTENCFFLISCVCHLLFSDLPFHKSSTNFCLYSWPKSLVRVCVCKFLSSFVSSLSLPCWMSFSLHFLWNSSTTCDRFHLHSRPPSLLEWFFLISTTAHTHTHSLCDHSAAHVSSSPSRLDTLVQFLTINCQPSTHVEL